MCSGIFEGITEVWEMEESSPAGLCHEHGSTHTAIKGETKVLQCIREPGGCIPIVQSVYNANHLQAVASYNRQIRVWHQSSHPTHGEKVNKHICQNISFLMLVLFGQHCKFYQTCFCAVPFKTQLQLTDQ